jgi:DNA-binding CsgD family transcriptional regulator
LEHKMDVLVSKGILIMKDNIEPFLEDWNKVKIYLLKKQTPLLNEFDAIIQFAVRQLFILQGSLEKFSVLLISEWNKRYRVVEDSDAIFLISIIENLFQKTLSKRDTDTITFLDRQAVQTFFTRIIDQILMTRQVEDQTEKWLKMMIKVKVVPVKWMAAIKNEEKTLEISKVVCSEDIVINDQFIKVCEGLKGSNLKDLELALMRLLTPGRENEQIVSVSFMNEQLLLCTQHSDQVVTEENKELLRRIYLRHMRLKHLENEIVWKDSSLLFLQSLLRSKNASKAVELITEGLVDYLPFSRCALFIYSPGEHSGVGVYGHNIDHQSIQGIKEGIDHFPLLKKYLSQLNFSKPIYLSDAAGALPEKYISKFQLKSLIVVPIFVPTENRLIGIALLDKGENNFFSVNTQTLTALIKFGQYAGEVLNKYWEEAIQQFGVQQSILSPREIEVMKLMAEGASINDAANQLHLSAYTVRDYVSAIIQKLNARNRTEAAVKAVKMQII